MSLTHEIDVQVTKLIFSMRMDNGINEFISVLLKGNLFTPVEFNLIPTQQDETTNMIIRCYYKGHRVSSGGNEQN